MATKVIDTTKRVRTYVAPRKTMKYTGNNTYVNIKNSLVIKGD